MANGFPLAAICGPAKYMQHASHVSGTFGGECLSLAAARATLTVYQTEPVIKSLWDTGAALMEGFNALDTNLKMVGYAVHPRLVGEGRDAFIAAWAKEGVLWHPSGSNVSFSHGDAEVEESLHAAKRALGAIS
jgi:glutamate-1-semialdehyde aminotransferase